MATPPTGKPVGRPHLYQPEYCDTIGPVMSEGLSILSFAASIGVCRDTIMNWADEYPEFFRAVKSAKAASAAWWEQRLRTQAESPTPPGSVTASIFALKNLGRDEWRERSETDNNTTVHAGDGIAALLTAINGSTRTLG